MSGLDGLGWPTNDDKQEAGGDCSTDLLAVAVGQEYKNPYDGPGGGPTIRIVHVEGYEAVCCWRYAGSTRNPLKAFVKSCADIRADWNLIPSANADVLARGESATPATPKPQ